MAVAPTGAIYKSLIFDGEDSRGYGVYITGQAVFNAPEREVEMITIPARNGLFALDQGRFENIEVTYPAGIFADSDADFAQAISDFRNFLCSRKGYCRLTDDYNPDEYRMAIYKSGLEVTPATLTAGQFNITFDCKPQRFLMSGETAITVASGDTITNPTLFDASPLLEVTGYGNININSEQITVQIIELGEIALNLSSNKATVTLKDASMLNTGDSIYDKYNQPYIGLTYKKKSGATKLLSGVTIQTTSGSVSDSWINLNKQMFARLGPIAFVKGTTGTISGSVTVRFSFTDSTLVTGTMSLTLTYDGNDKMTLSYVLTDFPETELLFTPSYYHPAYDGDSSQSANPDPTYIDLDIGEVYGYVNHTLTQLNNTAILPANLPELNSGANTITYSNTVTALKVIPRWWKI